MNYQSIDIEQGNQLIVEKNPIVVDVRDGGSFQAAHIKNALSVNGTNLDDFLQNSEKSKPLLVYCYHGNMSRSAAEYFSGAGFDDVYSLDGGFESWKLKYPVESGG